MEFVSFLVRIHLLLQKRQKHDQWGDRIDAVGHSWFHLNPRSRLACHSLFADSNFCFAIDNLNDRRQWRDVFFEAAASGKGEQYNLCTVVVCQNDAVFARFRWLDLIEQLVDLVAGHGCLDSEMNAKNGSPKRVVRFP